MAKKTIRLTDTATGMSITIKKVTRRQMAMYKPQPVYVMTAPTSRGGTHSEEISRAAVKAMFTELRGRLRVSREA